MNSFAKHFDPFFVGFDEIFGKLEKQTSNFPPYNIKKVSNKEYLIELALAGFTKADITIDVTGDTLTIKGKSSNAEKGEYLFRGIGKRSFTRTFALNMDVEVAGASMQDGILSIRLNHKYSKQIDIKIEDSLPEIDKQLLTEAPTL